MRTVNFLLPHCAPHPSPGAPASTVNEFSHKVSSARLPRWRYLALAPTRRPMTTGSVSASASTSPIVATGPSASPTSRTASTKRRMRAAHSTRRAVQAGRRRPLRSGVRGDRLRPDFRNLTNPNPYFPLAIGSRWEYRSAEETDVVQMLNRTKLIDDVRCIVVRDEVSKTACSTKEPTTGSRKRRTAPSGIAARKPRRSRRSKAIGR